MYINTEAMKIKYNRISTIEQNLDRQNLNANKFDKVYNDKVSGSISFFDRPQASKLVNDIKSGKVTEIHVNAIDRIGRSIIDILLVEAFLSDNHVNLYVENIGMFSMINGNVNPTFKLILSVLGNVAEMERNSMLERQRQGIEVAKAKGTYKGRLYGTKMTDEETLAKYKKVVKELSNGESLRRSASIGGCSLGTAQKIQRILKQAA
jgi:DNA invertase Pin-like site-specific DNA recombinase